MCALFRDNMALVTWRRRRREKSEWLELRIPATRLTSATYTRNLSFQYPDNNKNTSYLKMISPQQQHHYTELTTRSNKRQHSYKQTHNPLRRPELERPTYLRNNIYLYIVIVILIIFNFSFNLTFN
jgi:hypothetical protein